MRASGHGSWIARRAALVVTIGCAWCALWAASAVAAAVRLASGHVPAVGQNASVPQEAYPQVVVDAAGDAVAVWLSDRGDGTSVVLAASRPAGGAWQPPGRPVGRSQVC